MHPTLEKLMRGFNTRNIELNMGWLLRACGLKKLNELPRLPDKRICYRWILGQCGKEASGNCTFGRNEHLPAKDVPDTFATDLANKLKIGVDKLVQEHDNRNTNKKQRD